MCYMLSAYIAFLIGSSRELSVFLILFVPIGFIAGYFLDRLGGVKQLWHEDRSRIYKMTVIRYVFFLLISLGFMFAGLVFAAKFYTS